MSSGSSTAYGLGLAADMDISTASGGGAARAQLLSVLTNIQKIYQTENAPPTTAATSATASSPIANAPPSAYATAQLANYTLALNMLSGASSG